MIKKRTRAWGLALVAACATTALAAPRGVEAQNVPGRAGMVAYEDETVAVEVALNKSEVLTFPRAIKRVSVGNPNVADILVVRSRQLYIVGKSTGATNVVLWDGNGNVQGVLNVQVHQDVELLKAKLHELLPGEGIQVRTSHGAIVLSGEVSSATRLDAAARVAESFSTANGGDDGPRVLNLMQVGGAQQVMLDVKVAEVSRTLVKRLNIQFDAFNSGTPWKLGAVNGGARFPDAEFADGVGSSARVPVFGDGTPIGPAVDEFAPGSRVIEDAGLFASYLSGDFLFNAVFDAAHQDGLARILAEPNLTTLTGEPASFIAGGEFPIPVPSGEDRITIEFKEFGVGLNFLPTVLDSGVINLKVDVEVSELVPQNNLTVGFGGSDVSQNFFVPSLVKRSATSTVELASGRTIAIAGMINENLRENVNKFPGLGNVPILGMLFRSQEFIKDQTELVIFVTPRLARSVDPKDVHLPTDGFVEPTDLEFYLLGRMSARRPGALSTEAASVTGAGNGGTDGRFGHDLGQ
ncbi:type II and III secretion system protein family protein [Arhodomonas sp. AD133]|uniref:type II and III secretion system protein family protein n=1 Tax=Arhodomonas sp. AD133 TaxID=3415009 RepID=UPI003EBCC8AA